jgi:predicted amidohydrolase
MRVILVQPQLRFGAEADNLTTIRAALDEAQVRCALDDILLLPESFDPGRAHDRYRRDVAALAVQLGCHVVGGSHREPLRDGSVNAGLAFDPRGNVIGRYEKLRPYASERNHVRAGTALGELTIAGHTVLVLICADFWFADLFQRATRVPDLLLVPALSVTRKPTPEYARALWRHLAVARAYEFGVYVGISDWGYPSQLPLQFACGVGGFADPTTAAPERLFSPIGQRSVAVHPIDFSTLADFRLDRAARGFLWQPPLCTPASYVDS